MEPTKYSVHYKNAVGMNISIQVQGDTVEEAQENAKFYADQDSGATDVIVFMSVTDENGDVSQVAVSSYDGTEWASTVAP